MLPHKGGVCVVGLIGSLLWAYKAAFYDVPPDHFKGLPVFFIHAEHKSGQHGKDHYHCRNGCPRAVFE